MFEDVLLSIGQFFLLSFIAPLITGVIKKVKARLQNRQGPGIFQMYFDLGKLLAKDSVISSTASWFFHAAPFIVFASTGAASALVPVVMFHSGGPFLFVDFFVLVYLLAIGRFFLTLASLDTGSAFGGMGGAREMFIAVLVEPALLLAMMTVAVKSGTAGLAGMALAAGGVPFSLAHIFAAVAFFIVVIAEAGRIPVDNPDTHLELTMIHEGMILEYSGRYLGLVLWASAMKQLTMILLFVVLFLPWDFGVTSWLAKVLLVFGKTLFIAVCLAVIESSTNKMRLFKVPGFLALSCFLSILALAAQ